MRELEVFEFIVFKCCRFPRFLSAIKMEKIWVRMYSTKFDLLKLLNLF